MYDLAKRSLAFAVATGGLLLTGTAFSPAFAVAGSGAIQGPAQAQGVRIDAVSASSPVNAAHRDATTTTGFRARAAQAPPGSLPPDPLRSSASASASASASGAVAAGGAAPIPACDNTVGALVARDGTAWTYCVTDSGPGADGAQAAGVAGGPARTLIEVCGNTVAAGPIESFETGSSCTNTAEGSAPTVPGAPAPGTGGASATAVSVTDGGAAAAAERAPAAGFIAACEHVTAARMFARDGNGCGTVRAEAARFKILGRSGGAGSAAAAGTRMNVPLTVCDDLVQAGTGQDGHGAGRCTASPTWSSTSPSPSHCDCSATEPIHAQPPPPPPPPSPVPSRRPWKCDCPVTAPVHPSPPPPPPAPSRHPWKCGCSHTPPTYPPPPSRPPTKCACSQSPSPSWPPPPPPSSPAPPHSWPPSWSGSQPASPSSSPWHHPGGPPHNGNGGGLAHTGTDIGIALGVAGAALLGGLGLRAAARRREGRS